MGRTRPVHQADFDTMGWDFDEPATFDGTLSVGDRVAVSFLFETGEQDEDGDPLVAAMDIPVQVIAAEAGAYTGVLLAAPSIEATLCMFSAVRFEAPHVSGRIERGDDEELAMVERGLKKEPENAQLYFARAAMREKRGDHKGAIADLDRCIAADDSKHEVRASRGLCHGVLGDEDAALADFSRAAELAQAQGDEENANMLLETIAMLQFAYGPLQDIAPDGAPTA